MPLLKHQQQKLSSNCGPACVAILAGTTQGLACQAMFGKGRREDYSSDWTDIRRALKRLGLRFGDRANHVSRWESVPTTAIVACCRRTKGNHVVVCSPDEELIYDPRRKRPQPLNGTRRRPFSYLSVKPRI